MKNFKKIIALATSVLMLSSVCAFAAIPEDETDVSGLNATAETALSYILSSNVGDTVKAGDTFDVSVKVGAKDSADYVGLKVLTFDIEYDSALFDVAVSSEQPTKKSGSSFTGYDEEDYFWAANASTTNINSGVVHTAKVKSGTLKYAGYFNEGSLHCVSTENTFLTFTFTVKDDAVATEDVTLSLTGCSATDYYQQVEITDVTATGSYTFDIVGSAPSEDKTITSKTDATTGATVLEYGKDVPAEQKTLADKYIVMGTATAAAGQLTKDSRVTVKYADPAKPELNKEVKYGKTIFEYLKIETTEGAVNTKVVKFGIVYDDAKYLAQYFSFDIN